MATKEGCGEWQLSKTINISHIIATLTLMVGMVTYIGAIEKQVAIQGVQIHSLTSALELQRKSNTAMFNRIDRKLDRLFEVIHKAGK